MANWFDKDYYLHLKLLQLDAAGQRNGIKDTLINGESSLSEAPFDF